MTDDATLSAAERSVLGHLDEEVLVEQLAELVRIPSVGGTDAELEVQEYVAGALRDLDTDVDRWDIDLEEMAGDPWFPGVEVDRTAAVGVVGTTAGDGVPGLVLSGHTDVVPPGHVETWHGQDPFSAEIFDGALYGRGACDMKAGVAVNLAVLRTLRAAGVPLERPLAVHSVVGEEDGGLGAFATLRRGHRGDVAVITEPTSAKIVTATAGALTFRIEVVGRSAHGSMRKQGISALEAFLPIHAALMALEAERNRDIDREFVSELPYALSFGMVHTGDWSSSVPDKLVADGRFGVKIDEDPRLARTVFEDVVAEVALKDPWLHENRPVVTWPGGQFASGRLDDDHPLIGEMAAAVDAAGGMPHPPTVAGVYGSDMRLYTGVGGIPTLHYGPGDMSWAHAPLERVELSELVQVARALVVLALRRCAAPA
ncbi:ArgE/DapE family deacylase [Nocardioides mesophilus]|uniref:ArgE/DapE family deacylase n=1 Tax=Nocardioides mesophilus TaxID=433659 RepID=A0A7G9RDB9_9ACTN|nr:ArgE/DapE family deacylase [Nocardioides mesophilus]QNN53594.1 ArgE/DapE family deacylase [Nocardioides mesophilus]